MNIADFFIDFDDFRKSYNRVKDNTIISGFYHSMFEDMNDEVFLSRSKSVSSCYKIWDVDYYRQQGVKDVKRVNFCHDKFCRGCQNRLSQSRYLKYLPLIAEYQKDYDIYHVTFTVPNCSPSSLKTTLNKMYKKFVYINQYFLGQRKIRGLYFSQYGYVGAVRSLEITFKLNKGSLECHPHFHCLFILKKGLSFPKTITNTFSFDKKNPHVRNKYSSFEVMLQKIWYLVYNNQRVTLNNICELDIGYSCVVKKIGNTVKDIKDVFKYTLKGSFDDLKSNYDLFVQVYMALHSRRIIQGYGCLFNYNFEDDSLVEEVEELYFNVIAYLSSIELPSREYESLDLVKKLLNADSPIKYISKFSIRREIANYDT